MKRKKIKTIFCHMAIITICMGVFCHGYINGVSISGNDRIHSYAEAVSIDRDDLVSSFRDYCMSRNLVIDGTVAGSALSWTGNMLDDLCKSIGVDITYLQAQINKEIGGNLGVRWLVNATGMNIFNRLFAELLQREQLSVGSENVNKLVMSTEWFTDADGNGCMVYTFSSTSGQGQNRLIKKGSVYKYSGDVLRTMAESGSASVTAHLTENQTVTNSVGYDSSSVYMINGSAHVSVYSYRYGAGGLCIFRVTNDGTNSLYYGGWRPNSATVVTTIYNGMLAKITDGETEPTDITVKTPADKKILPDPPEEPTTIYPGGGTDDNPDDPGDEPDNWNPTTPTIPDPSSPDFPSIELPDIDIPDLPSLNFSLGDLRNKFPFSLPFDIIAVLNVLDGEPQAPHIEATVPIGRWYTWEMDFDFSEFDNYARIFRAFEFIGFCIGLAIFTVHFVKG